MSDLTRRGTGAVDAKPDVDTTPLLRVHNLDAFYGQVQALRQVSLQVYAGEIVTVVGANGAGKTTLLRAISGMSPAIRGEIRFQGQPIAHLRPHQIAGLGISHVPERRELFSSMTVMENLELGAYHYRAERDTSLDLVWQLFPILRSRRTQMAGTLSGGEQQMLAIARGLMSCPQMILLDEPSLGLAPLLVQEVLRIVGGLRDMGRAVLLVEQNAIGALHVADRAHVMELGRLVMSGPASAFLHDDRIRQAYLGQRIAPMRPHRAVAPAGEACPEKREEPAGGSAKPFPRQPLKESQEMDARLIPMLTFTLPDEFFEERMSLTLSQIQTVQDRALPQAFANAYEHSRLYHEKFSAAGLTPTSVQGLHDLARLPFTTTAEIRPNPAHGRTSEDMLAVDQRLVTIVHRSSGTTGAPKIFPYTGRDMARWAANVATTLWIAGLRKDDVLLLPGLSREFTGSGGGYLGALTLGTTCIPMTIGPGFSESVLAHLLGHIRVDGKEIMLDPLLRANAIFCLASFLPRLLEILDESGLEAGDLSLTKIISGAEPSSDAVRMRVAERLGIWPRDEYGLGEFYGPGVASECEAGGCLHVLSDTFIAEVVDPETGERTPEGGVGELVLTSLHKEALPLFRYRTGDRAMALPQRSACPCGMAHMRIGRVTGRIHTDDIVIPGGIVLNRTYLEDVLLPVDGVGYEYIATVAEHPQRKGLQQFYIAVEAAQPEGEQNPKLADVITHRFQVEYKYTPVVHLLPKGALPRTGGKARRLCSPDEYAALVHNTPEAS